MMVTRSSSNSANSNSNYSAVFRKSAAGKALGMTLLCLCFLAFIFSGRDSYIVSSSGSIVWSPYHNKNNNYKKDRKDKSLAAFSLLVTLTFSAEEHKLQFLQDIAPVATYCEEHEPETLAYEVLLSDKDPLQVLVLERYRDKARAYQQIHRSSKPFLEFRPKLQAMQNSGYVTVDGQSYIDSMVGFVGRAPT